MMPMSPQSPTYPSVLCWMVVSKTLEYNKSWCLCWCCHYCCWGPLSLQGSISSRQLPGRHRASWESNFHLCRHTSWRQYLNGWVCKIRWPFGLKTSGCLISLSPSLASREKNETELRLNWERETACPAAQYLVITGIIERFWTRSF